MTEITFKNLFYIVIIKLIETFLEVRNNND